MTLVHKSLDVRPELWRKLRINAELSGVSLRDFLAYLIDQSVPVPDQDSAAKARLDHVAQENEEARARTKEAKPADG